MKRFVFVATVAILFSAAQAHFGHEVIITSPQQMEMVATTQAVCAADTARLCPDAIKAEVDLKQKMEQHHHGHHSCHMRMLRFGMMLFPGLFFHKHMMWMHQHDMIPELASGPMLGFGAHVDRCLLAKFRDAAPPCKAAIVEAQALAWQASEVVSEAMHAAHPHHGPHGGRHYFAMAIVACLFLSVVMMFVTGIRSSKAVDWRQRRQHFRKIMQAIRGDAELTAHVESVVGEPLPPAIADRKSGCMCVRLLSSLVFSVMLGLAGAAPLLVLWAFAFWFGYITGLCCCRRGSSRAAAPPSYTVEPVECKSAPPSYTPRTAASSYVYLEEGASLPSVVVGSHITV